MSVIRYEDSSHTYWYGNTRYTSATQVIELFKPKFDTEGQAKKYAQKHGKTAEYWMKYWKQMNLKSLDRGNRIHDLHDSIVYNRSIDVIHGRPLKVQNPDLFSNELPLSKFPDGIYTDNRNRVLYHHGYQIAGRPDKFAIETVNGKRYVHIDDYKTNKRLRTHSFRFEDGSYQMMKGPVDHLMDCEMVHYQLQLSLYMLMFEYHGFTPGKMRLIHFPHVPEAAPEGAEDPPPITYEVEYAKKDVVKMLNHIKRKQMI